MKNLLSFRLPFYLVALVFIGLSACEKTPLDEPLTSTPVRDISLTPKSPDVIPAQNGPSPLLTYKVPAEHASALPASDGPRRTPRLATTLKAEHPLGPKDARTPHATQDVLPAENADVIPAHDGPRKPAITELQAQGVSIDVKPAVSFRFDVAISPCILSGNSVSVSIVKPENYTIWWEIDGKPAGRGTSIPGCISGKYVQVWVMRNADRLVQTQVVQLPNAGPDNH